MISCEKCNEPSELVEECGKLICSSCGEVNSSSVVFLTEPPHRQILSTEHGSIQRPFLNTSTNAQVSKFDKTYSFIKKRQERQIMNNLFSALKMGPAMSEQALTLSHRFKQKGFKRKSFLNNTQIGACCYLVAIANSQIVSKSEISKLLAVSELELVKQYKKIKKICLGDIAQQQRRLNQLDFIPKVIYDLFGAIERWPNKYTDPMFSDISKLNAQSIELDLKSLVDLIHPTCFMEGKDRFKLTKALLVIILQKQLDLKIVPLQIRHLATYFDCSEISLYREYLQCRNVVILLIMKYLPICKSSFVDRNFYQYIEDLFKMKDEIAQQENEGSKISGNLDSSVCIPSFRKTALENQIHNESNSESR